MINVNFAGGIVAGRLINVIWDPVTAVCPAIPPGQVLTPTGVGYPRSTEHIAAHVDKTRSTSPPEIPPTNKRSFFCNVKELAEIFELFR